MTWLEIRSDTDNPISTLYNLAYAKRAFSVKREDEQIDIYITFQDGPVHIRTTTPERFEEDWAWIYGELKGYSRPAQIQLAGRVESFES